MSAPADRSDDDLLAFEWALGLLDPAERALAEARRTRDGAFAALCARRLADAHDLLETVDVEPTAGAWTAIERRIDGDARVRRLERSVRWWRGLAAACALGGAGLGTVLAVQSSRTPVAAPAPAPVIALLTAPDSGAVLSVSIDRVSGRLVSARHNVATGPRVAELWVIPSDQVPRPLGLLTPQARPAVDARYLGLLTPGATLAVSLEPLGGSPTGKPTGPVIATGAISNG